MVDDTGFTAHEAVLASTLSAARLLKQEENLGSLDAGKFADMVGYADDPLADIHVVRDPRLVVKGGEAFRNEL